MNSMDFLPWQIETAQDWLGHRERFAHAWLIHGLAGIGKKSFAFAAAASLLCESPVQGLACNNCLACGWVKLGHHPDLKRIRPEAVAVEEGAAQASDAESTEIEVAETGGSKRAPSKEIRVEQIRSLETWFNTGTHRSGYRVVLIYPAESLNVISANALLKVLEEPAAKTVFLIVADAPDRLLPTLLSRCRRLPLSTPTRAQALSWLSKHSINNPEEWLAAAGGAPVLARQLASQQEEACPQWLSRLFGSMVAQQSIDVGHLADVLAKATTSEWLDCLQRACVDLVLASHLLPSRYFPALRKSATDLVANADPQALSELSQWVGQQMRLATHPLNTKLFAQSVIQRFISACKPSKFSKSPYVR